MNTKQTATALSISALTAGMAHGAIIYTDVDPDNTVTITDKISIDLNNDGNPDFQVRFDGLGTSMNNSKPFISNAYNTTGAYVLANTNGGIPATVFGTAIDSSYLSTNANGYFYQNYNKDVIGGWPNTTNTDAYVGVELVDNSQNVNFGWVHFSYNASDANTKTLTLKGYAYEDVQGVGIVCGATNPLTYPIIYTPPDSATIPGGGNVQLKVSALGAPVMTYQWMARPIGGGTFTNLVDGGNVSGSTTPVLTITAGTTLNMAEYEIVVTNSLGTASATAKLNVIAAKLSNLSPSSEKLYAGQTAQFNVTVTSGVPPSYQWQKNGVNLVNGSGISGATSANLLVSNVDASATGNYSVVVTTIYGSVTSSNVPLAIVAANGGAYERAVLTNSPVAYYRLSETDSAYNGGVLAFDYAGGYNGIYDVSVYNNVAGPLPSDGLPGFNSDNTGLQMFQNVATSRVALAPWNLNTNTVSFVAWIKPTGPQYSGCGILYTRSVSNLVCGLTVGTTDDTGSTPLTYNWNDQYGAYTFAPNLSVPADQWSMVALVITPTNATIYAVNSNLVKSAVNTMSHGVQSFNDVEYIGCDPAAAANPRTFNGNIDEVSIYKKSLSLEQVANLYIAASGSPGIPPQILTQPTAQVLYTNQTAHFVMMATGPQPLTYHWYYSNGGTFTTVSDSANISGSATGQLTIKNVSAANIGNYYAVVTNPGGTVTSSNVSLTLIPLSGELSQKTTLAQQPLVFYEFNELKDPSLGNVVAFDHINGFNALYGTSVVNGFSNVAGPRTADGYPGFSNTNTAALFTPATNYQSQVTIPPLNITTDTISFTAWINPSGPQQQWAGLIFQRPTSDSRSGLNYGGTNTDGSVPLGYHWNDDYFTYNWNSGMIPPPNQWSFVALVVTPSSATIWMINANGTSSAVHNYPHQVTTFDSAIAIGKDAMNGSTNNCFWGAMDDVGIYASALTSDQITTLYKGGQGIVVLPLVTLSIQPVPTGLQLTWPQGALLESTNVTGPWTTNSSATSGFITAPAAGQKFYRVLVQ